MDLVNLARTSKALRQVLMSRKSMWVWIAARRNTPAIMAPDPPEDMSEPAWALLLFGPPVCSVRSQSFAHTFDFKLIFGHSNALRKTSIGSTLRFAVACAPSVRRESDVDFDFLHIDLDDPDRDFRAALSTQLDSGFDALT
jgi:hypothetical protein